MKIFRTKQKKRKESKNKTPSTQTSKKEMEVKRVGGALLPIFGACFPALAAVVNSFASLVSTSVELYQKKKCVELGDHIKAKPSKATRYSSRHVLTSCP